MLWFWSPRPAAIAALALVACSSPADNGPKRFSFAVFGDGPYYGIEKGRYRHVLKEIDEHDVAFMLHVGDILWYPCSEEAYRERRVGLDALRHPVIYTPGDNEWTDCHERRPGGYDPLDRLAVLRRVFFDEPMWSLGTSRLALTVQAADSGFATFVENARWVQDSVVFATTHIVGSANGTQPFAGRTAANDAEAERRMAAAVVWTRNAFRLAIATNAPAVVLAMHADPDFEHRYPEDTVFEPLMAVWREEARAYDRPILLVHGDNHEYTIDQPLVDPATGDTVRNFTRLETFGSPDIGWVEVIVDPTDPRMFRFVPRVAGRWRLF